MYFILLLKPENLLLRPFFIGNSANNSAKSLIIDESALKQGKL
tara:strand:+ start:13892 stop:14020 length:129 start_codon:yes stop_codon:yes gene_type:complete